MIKGVNKNIIEINEFDSPIFEKAILFVRPTAKNFSIVGLNSEARKYLKKLDQSKTEAFPTRKTRRKKVIRNRIILFAICIAALGMLVAIISFII